MLRSSQPKAKKAVALQHEASGTSNMHRKPTFPLKTGDAQDRGQRRKTRYVPNRQRRLARHSGKDASFFPLFPA